MGKEIKLQTWKERRIYLVQFQKELIKKFPEQNYNVFVFGSYITNHFDSESSDIDLVVYCSENGRKWEINDFVKEFWNEKIGLECDVINYIFDPGASIFLNAIPGGIRLTDYYPTKLKDELMIIWRQYQVDRKKYLQRQKHQIWRMALNKRKREGGVLSGRYSR